MDTRRDSISAELGTAAGAVGLFLLGAVATLFWLQVLDPALRSGDVAGAVRSLAGFLVALAAVGVLIFEGLNVVQVVWRLFAQDATFQRRLSSLAQGGVGGQVRYPGWYIAWAVWLAVRRPMIGSALGLALLGVAGWMCG